MEQNEKINLEWIRKISLRSLMQLKREQLLILQYQADKELFSAQLTKDWIDSAIRFQLLEDAKGGGQND